VRAWARHANHSRTPGQLAIATAVHPQITHGAIIMRNIDRTNIDSTPMVRIGPGCTRRDLPHFNGNRAWIVDIEPGCSWPFADQHDEKGELVLVLSGDLMEDGETFGPGSYLLYGPGSSHTPSTRHGVRLFGLNAA